MMDAHVRLYRAQYPGESSHVMRATRRYLVGCKRKWGTARGLAHYRVLVDTYLLAKRRVTLAA